MDSWAGLHYCADHKTRESCCIDMILTAASFARAGVPTMIRAPVADESDPFFDFLRAAFLVGAERYSYVAMGVGWDGAPKSFPWFEKYSLPLGAPLGRMTVVDGPRGVFSREFEHASVSINVSAWTGRVTQKLDDGEATALLPDTLGIGSLHLAACDGGSASQLFRLNASGSVVASGATDGGNRSYCWDCSGCALSDPVFSSTCQPGNSNQRWTVSNLQGKWVSVGVPAGSSSRSLASCLTAHRDGRAELLLQACNASDPGQQWTALSTKGGAMASRLFPHRCADAAPVDFTGIEGGYQLRYSSSSSAPLRSRRRTRPRSAK